MRTVRSLIFSALLFPLTAAAQSSFDVGGFLFANMTFEEIIQNLLGVLMGTAIFVCAAVFLIGATFYMTSAGGEDRKGYGKGMMIGSAVAMGVIAGARGIMNAVLFFLYGG